MEGLSSMIEVESCVGTFTSAEAVVSGTSTLNSVQHFQLEENNITRLHPQQCPYGGTIRSSTKKKCRGIARRCVTCLTPL